ncbi:glutamate--cysteine ligase family protein [Ferrimonas marina]|uniref:Gamma-glutamyl:cysteine ligase YbdK, ATP-grasp superfamily n=1 Tax=Ferrimonas marina TaxID=299255 RepID=A0A1M5X3F7_9GAMM|nr:glutamate--cysteine ligase [Ferrimonas marina]SHH94350.1 Gamma-glutamyl:cysteine ligase YbdK, ATP-grasp superfamily [Ferrimonas marina]
MGQTVTEQHFSQQDHHRFERQLTEDLDCLAQLLTDPDWGRGERTLGAELELYLLDQEQGPWMANQQLLKAAADPHLTPELNRFNLEYNCPYTQCQGSPFSQLGGQMTRQLSQLQHLASEMGGQVTAIGILPTLKSAHFGLSSMTDEPRYHQLTRALKQRRDGPFQICINGPDRLMMSADDLTLEGANTSFQLHLRVDPAEFADWFNAIQLATPFVMALSGNAPLFLGRRLWQETRIALFKQSIDCRNLCDTPWDPPARVSFGKGYVRHSAIELFRQGTSLFPVILPDWHRVEDKPGEGPALHALRLHQGTIWSWNRPVYDPAGGGHLRIEMRTLPAGPTIDDMMANAALLLGLAQSFRAQIDSLIDRLPFDFAEYNFYRAAQSGLEAKLLWPGQRLLLQEQPVVPLLEAMLPQAQTGLEQLGIDSDEAARLMTLLAERLARGQTGAQWQLRALAKLEQQHDHDTALRRMVQHYCELSRSGQPVAQWELPA